MCYFIYKYILYEHLFVTLHGNVQIHLQIKLDLCEDYL